MSAIQIVGVAILLKEDGRFLFELQKPVKWRRGQNGVLRIGMGCIGGTVEEDETIEEALSREALEEIRCKIAFDRSRHPFSIDPAGAVSLLSPESVPKGVQFLWEGSDPGFIPGGKVAVYLGQAIGRAEPGDLPAIVKLEPRLFYDHGARSLTMREVEQRGGIFQ